jgi:hypothetical protein
MDLVGTDVNAYFRRAMSLALTFGRIHAVTDRLRFDSPAENRGQQLERGERSYTYLITPLDLVDWSTDRQGNFNWAVVMEQQDDVRRPGETVEPRGLQYRVWTTERWDLYREVTKEEAVRAPNNEKFMHIGGDTHDVGRVPIATLYATQLNEAADQAIESPVSDHCDINRDTLNRLSELDEAERSQAFELLGIPTADGESVGPIDIGYWSAFTFPASAGAPAYIGADPSHPQGKMDRIERKIFMSKDLAAVSRVTASRSKEERSAEALSMESEDKRNQLALWQQALKEFDQDVHEMLGKWEDETPPPPAVYMSDFDSKATTTAVNELVQMSAVPLIKRALKAQAAIARPIVRRIMTDAGEDEKKIEDTLNTLDEEAESVKAALNANQDTDDQNEVVN